ncbi:MAG: chromosome partitioning protein ParA, partial [Hymenobacter sp.]
MIYTIGGIKGGSSKTTIATNLVVFLLQQKRKVLLVDADDQASAASFTDVRSQLHDAVGYEMQQLTGRTLHQQVFALAGEYDDIVIDTGGRDTVSQRAALTVSDVFLVPFA